MEVVNCREKLYHYRKTRLSNGIYAAEIQTLFVGWTFQDVHRPLSVEIPGQQGSVGGNICWCLIFFQEFDFEIIVKHSGFNLGPYHLSRIESGEDPSNLDDNLPDALLFSINMFDDQYRDIVQFLSTGYKPDEFALV